MRYFAKDLQSVYQILETLPKPLAVIDFMSGHVGAEFAVAQSAGGQFYDRWNQDAHVVALCWDGASLLYSNVSDDQIEFTNKALSMLGNKEGRPWKRLHWLKKQGHVGRLAAIAGIVARCGPYDVSGKAMRRHHGLDTGKQWEMIKERLPRTGYVFSTGDPPLIQEPYIAIFDRNEQYQRYRNTRRWQGALFRQWAKSFGFKLVAISGFYPRRWEEDVIRIPFADRNLDRLCNIIHHSVLYAGPASGAGVAGIIFGCNYVGLFMDLKNWALITRDVMPKVIEGRGFRHLGFLDSPDGKVANRVREYLEKEARNI